MSGFRAFDNLERDRALREQNRENSARPATCFLRYRTQGGGSTTGAVTFDVTFTEEPFLATGCQLDRSPDGALWRLPQVTAGVQRWTTRRAGNQTLYTGATMFFVVDSEPHYLPRTDGSDLAQRQQDAAAAPAALRPGFEALVQEAQDALELLANPPRVSITHHLAFSGNALKGAEIAELFEPAAARPFIFGSGG